MNSEEQVSDIRIYTLAEDCSGYDSPFWAQFGMSFLLEIKQKSETRRILFDTGSYAEPLLFNTEKLKIDLKTIDTIVISHNHFDHTGGLTEVVKQIGHEIPIFAHPDIFRISFALKPDYFYVGMPKVEGGIKREIERLGGKWVLSKDTIQLMPGVFYLGEIRKNEKAPFETTPSIDLMQLDENGVRRPDTVDDEISLAINSPKGIIVIATCAHPGIVSIIQGAIRVIGNHEVHAVIGGFHLLHSTAQRINKTITALQEFKIQRIIAGHCTGLQTEARLAQKFKDNFERLHAGKVITF